MHPQPKAGRRFAMCRFCMPFVGHACDDLVMALAPVQFWECIRGSGGYLLQSRPRLSEVLQPQQRVKLHFTEVVVGASCTAPALRLSRLGLVAAVMATVVVYRMHHLVCCFDCMSRLAHGIATCARA